MEERLLRELELLPVARLYGLVEAGPLPPPPGAPPPGTPVHPAAVTVAPPRAQPDASRRSAGSGESSTLPAVPAIDVSGLDWASLREAVLGCHRCRLCEKRKQAVFGVGAQAGPWLFVGEGPGAEEDERGEPFVGQAGKLLDAMLASLRLARGREAYIANVVKCRPPGNRVPSPDEVAACAPFLDRQIDLVRPGLIVALGKTAATRLTGHEGSLAGLRGRVLSYGGIPLVVTYHPAYLLRNLPDKAKAWEDLLFARRTLAAATATP